MSLMNWTSGGTQNLVWNGTIATGTSMSWGGSTTYTISGNSVFVPGPTKVNLNLNGLNITPPDAAPHGFNAFLNASDLLAEFARYAQKFGMDREDFLNLPIRYFVQWLVVEAAILDKVEVPPEVDPVVKIPHRHRCRACGKFLPNVFRRAGVMHCSPAHMEKTLLALG